MTFTKSQLKDWCETLTPTDLDYLSQSGGSYLEEIRQFEGIMRPLWGIIPAHGHNITNLKENFYIQSLTQLVEERNLPEISTANRQIAVELGIMGYALGKFGENFLALFSPPSQRYLIAWLNQVNEIEFPAGNWYFFLVLVNSGLKKMDLPYSEKQLTFAKKEIETFYLGEGWYSDGKNQQRDYYVAFAFHFYGLLYASFSNDSQ